jgi:hypothetical protein
MAAAAAADHCRCSWRGPHRSVAWSSCFQPVQEAAKGTTPPEACAEHPIVYRGLVSHWRALHWTRARLIDALPTARISRSASGTYPRDGDSACPVESITMAKLLSSPPSPQVYCHGNILPESLANDCPLPTSLSASVARRSLWMSGHGASTPLHYDLPSVLLCQLRGRKRVFLCVPTPTHTLTPTPAHTPAYCWKASKRGREPYYVLWLGAPSLRVCAYSDASARSFRTRPPTGTPPRSMTACVPGAPSGRR